MAEEGVSADSEVLERDRCPTGIEGLDNILNGGIPRGNTILFTGSCGTGKTTLSLEYLVHGALAGENCLFVSVTEASEKLMKNVIPYDFFDESLIKKGKLVFVDMPIIYERLGMTEMELSMEDVEALVRALGNLVDELSIKRLVIDSVTSVCYRLKTEEKIRNFILKVGKALSDRGCTSLLISEISPSAERYSLYGVEEAIADGIVLMGNLERRGDLLRTLQVVKMRGTNHSRAKYVLDLTPAGILLVPLLKGGSTGGN
ncbi:MAG: circadian clock protein KaiC [Candidatus Proteinoplasmatales archaeon SG8-5]|nr:MAG: circadian clock protein KaiC [Candidatus Proteinoplasmatales archaeon SG8-5]